MQELDAAAVSVWLHDNAVIEAVTIKKNGSPHAVLIPYALFEIMHRNNRSVLRADELTEQDLDAIWKSTPPDETRQFDDELDD